MCLAGLYSRLSKSAPKSLIWTVMMSLFEEVNYSKRFPGPLFLCVYFKRSCYMHDHMYTGCCDATITKSKLTSPTESTVHLPFQYCPQHIVPTDDMVYSNRTNICGDRV